jgi:DNA polymerase-3 subunit alpha (Gram-positive type)
VKTKYLCLKEHQNNQNNSIKLSNKQIDLIPIFEVCLEMFARGINVLNINLNKSKANEFVAIGNNILPPFASLDGLGIEVAESIVEARNERPFSSISDLQNRTKLTVTLIEKLKKMHVLDNLVIDDQLRLF